MKRKFNGEESTVEPYLKKRKIILDENKTNLINFLENFFKLPKIDLENKTTLKLEALIKQRGYNPSVWKENKFNRFLVKGCDKPYVWKNEGMYIKSKPFIKEIIKIDGDSFCCVHPELRGNKELMMEVIKKSKGYAIQIVSEELKNDRDIVIEALRGHKSHLKYAGSKIRDDKNFVLYLSTIRRFDFSYTSSWFSDRLLDDEEIATLIIKKARHNNRLLRHPFYYCSKRLKNDMNFIKKMTKLDPLMMQFLKKDLI